MIVWFMLSLVNTFNNCKFENLIFADDMEVIGKSVRKLSTTRQTPHDKSTICSNKWKKSTKPFVILLFYPVSISNLSS